MYVATDSAVRQTAFAKRKFTTSGGLTAEVARSLVAYDPATGELRWRSSPRYGIPAGALIATKNLRGYVQTCVAGFKTTGHRLAWLLHYGEWPQHVIDHINRDPGDNRIANLRDVPQAVNLLNREVTDRKSSNRIRIGVFARGNRFRSYAVRDGGKKVYAGTFDSREEARCAAAALQIN